ncbi:translocation/assembly module TamB domain-containing protein [Joostella sp. CR20]|uniref:translocation/assembly module TamB domain-containing protein n=1 Tax=Joostella sp. CR20 TaxID=2804312 RepID=UPI00313CA4BD
MPKNQKIIKNRFLRILLRVFLGILLLFFALILLIRSPWGQNLIVGKAVGFLSEKIGTTVKIDKIYITFSGNASLDGLYIEDQKGDTLIYSKNLEVATALLPLIRGTEVDLSLIDWEGVRANIHRDTLGVFNFDFITNAFATEDTTAVDTTTQTTKINLGNIRLSDINITYDDKFSGVDLQTSVGKLSADFDVFNLDKLQFELDDISLSDSKINYIQHHPFDKSVDTTSSNVLPFLRLSSVNISEVEAFYKSEVDAMTLETTINTLLLELPKLDLTNNEVVVETFSLENSKLFYADNSYPKTQTDTTASEKPISFEWPNWNVTADAIALENNEIQFKKVTTDTISGGFNPNDIQLKQFNFISEEISYQPSKASFNLKTLSFLEHNAFHLKDLNFNFQLTENLLELSSLHASTGRSRIAGEAKLQYSSFQSFLNDFESAKIQLELPDFAVNFQDAYYFQPDLASNAYIDSLAQKNIEGNIQLKGSLDSLAIQKSKLNWGENTSIAVDGSVTSVTNVDSLKLYFPTLKLKTLREDVTHFIAEDSLGILIPETLALTGNLQGSLNAIQTNLNLTSSDGSIVLKGNFKERPQLAFDAQLVVNQLNLGKIIQNENIGALSFEVNTKGQGNSLNNLDAVLTSKFDSLAYATYDFSNLKLNGTVKNGEGNLALAYKDDNLDFDLNTHMVLDTVNSKFDVFLDLKGADLYKLGFTNNDVRTGFKLNAVYKGDLSNFILDGKLTEGVAIYKNQSYNIDDFKFDVAIQNKETNVALFSNMLTANLKANATPDILINALEKQLSGYWKNSTDSLIVSSDSLQNTKMKLDVLLRHTPALSEVYLPGLDEMDSVYVAVNFDEATQKIDARVSAPYVKYKTTIIDSLQLDLLGSKDAVNFDFGWSGIQSDPLKIDRTKLQGALKNKKLTLDFNSKVANETLIQINSEARFSGDTIYYHIAPETLTINKNKWQIPATNQITYATKFIDVKDFTFSNNNQKIGLVKSSSAEGVEKVGVLFDNFKLNSILSFFNPEEPIVKGVAKGELNLENPFEQAGLQADLSISDFEALTVPLGKLSVKAISENYSDYTFDMALKEGNIDLDLSGNYIAQETDSKLDLDLSINDLKMQAIEAFSDGAVSNAKGSITGKTKLTGTTTNPTYSGNLNFEGVEVLVNQLNSVFKIDNQTLAFNNDGLKLNSFSIADEANNNFVLDGAISTENLTNPAFDLSLKASNFKVLNSTREDNDLFYGNVSLNTDLTIKGNLEIPKIEGKLKINEDSKFTVIVPESELDLNEREGVVVFVNRKNENDILTRKEAQATTTVLENLDIDVLLSVDKNSIFRIVIDERTGDNLQVSGTGEFNFAMEPNGRTTLSGQYEVSDGHYEASLYNIVKRRFEIEEGSKMTWNGDPLDAIMDIKAIYKVETSAASLMSLQTSNASTTDLNVYRQKYPFWVYLNIGGELLNPELSFNLDMPEDAQSAAGGNVYGYVQQLNNQEEELNKQVFSLLVMNRFFPASGSDGSTGGPASIARDNVNDVLSNQLNAFSDKILGDTGVQLDFGLDSYTDYQTASDRTELDINASKSLFNDRLVVQVGSEVDIQGSSQSSDGNAPVIGNVGLEYLITEDGRYRLRGYRKNKFESVIDGELIVTGISLIFNKEFNKFKELWERKVREEVAKEKAQKENEENSEKTNETN